jgi:hypothetical protein
MMYDNGYNSMTSPTERSPVGTALANAVANRLESGKILAHSHPEYCGIGLAYENGVFICAEVYEGQIMSQSQYQRSVAQGEAPEFLAFTTRAQFITWLAAQSDHLFSGQHLPNTWLHHNQRLSLARLHEFVS